MYVRELVVGLLLLIVGGGFAISVVERLTVGKALYFAFITSMTIGYGDITPETSAGRAISVAIGMIGTILTGIVVAIATRSLADLARSHQEEQK